MGRILAMILAGAVVRDSIVFSDCESGSGAVVERAILDKHVIVGNGAQVGLEQGLARESERFPRAKDGLTLVGKNTSVPAGLGVDRGCVIGSDVEERDFVNREMDFGGLVGMMD